MRMKLCSAIHPGREPLDRGLYASRCDKLSRRNGGRSSLLGEPPPESTLARWLRSNSTRLSHGPEKASSVTHSTVNS